MTELSSTELIGLFQVVNNAVLQAKDELNTLDLALGDGDHGTAISNAFMDAVAKLQSLADPSPTQVFTTVAQSLLNRMGGASGALYGTLFMRASTACKDKIILTKQDFATALRAGLNGVIERGKAQVGDKTMVDALLPAVEQFEKQSNFSGAFAAAAVAASDGAAKTIALVANYGRAKFAGERSVGHIDAGARSVAVIFTAMAIYWKEIQHGKA